MVRLSLENNEMLMTYENAIGTIVYVCVCCRVQETYI